MESAARETQLCVRSPGGCVNVNTFLKKGFFSVLLMYIPCGIRRNSRRGPVLSAHAYDVPSIVPSLSVRERDIPSLMEVTRPTETSNCRGADAAGRSRPKKVRMTPMRRKVLEQCSLLSCVWEPSFPFSRARHALVWMDPPRWLRPRPLLPPSVGTIAWIHSIFRRFAPPSSLQLALQPPCPLPGAPACDQRLSVLFQSFRRPPWPDRTQPARRPASPPTHLSLM